MMAAVALVLTTIGASAGTTMTSTDPFPAAKAEEVGLDPAAVKDIAARVRLWVEQEDAVGAELLIIKKRRTVLHEAYGLKDLDDREPLTPGTIACIRSMTKPIVGTAVQMLVDEGKLSIDDRVAKYLPSFANAKSEGVTIRQLLTHTGGFPLTTVDRALSSYKNGRDIADRAGAAGPPLEPDQFSYSDTDTEILASVIGQITGEPAEAFIERRILTPLGMSDTYPVLKPGAPDRSRVSSNHAGGAAAWHKYWDNQDPPFFPFFLGAAGMYSTAVDYAKFLAMWMDHGRAPTGQLITDAAVRRALAPATPMIEQGEPYPTRFTGNVHTSYGQHWMIYDGIPLSGDAPLPVFGHGGSDGTGAWAFPDRDLIVLLFTQSRGGVTAIRLERFVGALAGLASPAVTTLVAPPDADIEAVLGTYKGPNGYIYAVRQRSRVALQLPEGLAVLRWPDLQTRWALDTSLGSAAVRFSRDANGRVTGFDFLGGPQPTRYERTVAADALPNAADILKPRQFPDALEFTGTLTTKAAEGSIHVIAATDGRLSSDVAIATTRERTVVSAGRAWATNAEGTRELRGVFLEQVQLPHPFVRYGDRRAAYVSLTVDRRDRLDDKDVWVIRAVARTLPPATLYVSIDTGLLLREDGWITVKGVGTVPLTARFEDYRLVGDVQLPFRLTSESAVSGKLLIVYSSIKPVTVTEKTFAR